MKLLENQANPRAAREAPGEADVGKSSRRM